MAYFVSLLRRVLEIFKTILAFIGADLDSIKEQLSNLV